MVVETCGNPNQIRVTVHHDFFDFLKVPLTTGALNIDNTDPVSISQDVYGTVSVMKIDIQDAGTFKFFLLPQGLQCHGHIVETAKSPG
jgi:hypothetical protein